MKLWKKIYLLCGIISIFLSQYFYFKYIKFARYEYGFLLIVFLIIGIIFFIFNFYCIDRKYIIPFLFLIVGAYFSYKYSQALFPFVFYYMFTVLLFLLYKIRYSQYNLLNEIYLNKYIPSFTLIISFLLTTFIIIFLSFIIYKFFKYKDASVYWYFPLRQIGTKYNDIQGMPFKDYNRLILVELFVVLIFIINYFIIIKEKIKNNFTLIFLLILIAFIGKISIAYLSSWGLDILKLKITSKDGCTYYYFAKKHFFNIQEFIKNYTSFYQKWDQSAHLKGHPILPVLIYWIIIKIFGENPYVSALIIGIVSSLTVIPIFYIIKLLFKNYKLAYLGSLFYVLTANSLILSISGIDSLIVLFTGLSFVLFLYGIKNDNKLYLLSGGIAFGINSYLTFGIWHLLIFFILYFSVEIIITREVIKNFLKFSYNVLIYISGIIFFHLFMFLILNGDYNYFISFNIAKRYGIYQVSNRPYDLWVWGNFIHWSHYITPGIISLYFYRFYLALKNKIKMDFFSIFSMSIILTQFLSCIGRAEQHRMWMFLIIFVIPVSMIPLLYINKENKLDVHPIYSNIFTLFIALYSTGIEMFITDAL